MRGMEENPYQTPLETSGPVAPEGDGWPETLRRWSIGPRVPLAWFAMAGAIALLIAAMLA